MGTDRINMNKPKIDLVGKKFNRLKVLFQVSNHKRQTRWKCLCDCGAKTLAYGGHLKNGNTKSCGCLNREMTSKARKIHGHSRINSRTYHSWCAMKRRCLNSNAENYERYGGRGITICIRWLNSFNNFLADMGENPGKRYSIDRINNMGNYEPSNCRWATHEMQAQNRRKIGETKMLNQNGNKNQRAQGDVLMQRLEVLPNGCKEVKRQNGRIVVMHGESGHTHCIEDLDAMFYEKDGKHYLVATKPVVLKHEEHHAQTIEPGTWEIGQVREKDWLSGMVAPVVD